MSSDKSTSVQAEVNIPTLSDLNPLNSNEPLVQSLVQGEVPSNQQFNQAIDRAVGALEDSKASANLNDRGEQLVQDATDILETAQRFINEKNPDNRVQELLKHVKEGTSEVANEVSKVGEAVQSSIPSIPSIPSLSSVIPTSIPSLSSVASTVGSVLSDSIGLKDNLKDISLPDVNTDEMKEDAKEALNCGRELFYASIRSSEFRGLLSELVKFFQSSFLEATDKLKEIGEAVKNDVESGDVELKDTKKTTRRVAKKAKKVVLKPEEWSDELQQEYYEKFKGLLTKISEKPEYGRLLDLYWKWMDELKEKANEMSDTLQGKAEEISEKAEEIKENVKEKAKEVKKKAKKTATKAKDKAIETGAKAVDKLTEEGSAFDKVWNDVKGIVDEFAGEGSFNNFYSQVWNLFDSVYNNDETSDYFNSFKTFVMDAIKDPASLNTQDKMKEGKALLTQGRKITQSKQWSSKFNELFEGGSKLLNSFTADTLSNELTDKLKKFGEDFALDSKGRPNIFVIQDSISQIKNLVYPVLSKQFENMVIAKVAGTSESFEWSVENLLVSLPGLLPQSFQLKTKNLLSVDMEESSESKNITKVVLEISKLKPVFKDVKFWYRRTSFPHIEDNGTVDVDLSSGEGTKIKIVWKIKSKQNRPFSFSLMEVKCVIDKMDISFKDAKHEILDRIAVSLFMANIKQSVAEGIVDKIVEGLQPINDQMNQWFMSQPLNSLKNKVSSQITGIAEKGNEIIQNKPIEKAVEYAKDKYEVAKEKAQQTLEMAKEGIAEVKEKASEVADQVKEKSSGVVDQVKEKSSEVADMAVDKASELSNAVSESKLKRKADQLKDKAKDKVEEFMDTNSIPQSLSEAKDMVVDKASEVLSPSTRSNKQEWTSSWEKPSKKRVIRSTYTSTTTTKKSFADENPYGALNEESKSVNAK